MYVQLPTSFSQKYVSLSLFNFLVEIKVQDPITMVSQGSFALFSTRFPHPNHFGGCCMCQNRHIKVTILALPSFHFAVVTSYELQPVH